MAVLAVQVALAGLAATFLATVATAVWVAPVALAQMVEMAQTA
jgi:hypothetical protein